MYNLHERTASRRSSPRDRLETKHLAVEPIYRRYDLSRVNEMKEINDKKEKREKESRRFF